ncbi:MAG: UDP-N-acetylglucosamine 2-epimerase (non-hydrolyzing) [Candidatus Acidiferrum sp.]
MKLSPLCRAIAEHNSQNPSSPIEHLIINTGQHYDREVAGVFFDQMEIPAPNFNLGVGSGSAGTQLARMLARMESILAAIQPDWVIVYGDTNSTLAGALLASRLNIPLAHVEAGCRSGQLSQPEEQNRIVTDHLSQLLFPASENDCRNLYREGIACSNDPLQRRAILVGDILFDALLQNSAIAEPRAEEHLRSLGIQSKNFYLLTIHRAQNTDDPKRLHSICKAVSSLDLPVLFPIHPRTAKIMQREGISLNGNIIPVPPQGYLEMITVENHARMILTDSGGVQKEAFYLRVPCVTLREQTEWTETVDLGANQLVGASCEKILSAVRTPVTPDWRSRQPYGDGNAGRRIVADLSATPRRVAVPHDGLASERSIAVAKAAS